MPMSFDRTPNEKADLSSQVPMMAHPQKCDVLIPAHSETFWLPHCVEAVIRHTPSEYLGRIVLVDDCSDSLTRSTIEEIAGKYSNVKVLSHPRRKGYPAAVNTGLKETLAPYILVLNTDCLLTANAVPKLVNHCVSDSTIGCVSPFSNNSPPLTYSMIHGYTYHDMNRLFETLFAGQSGNACTISGHALLVSRKCLEATGEFDESYGLGYGEETDFQFRAMQKGFRAVGALDTYVFHMGGATFGYHPEVERLRNQGRVKFFKRWRREFEDYSKHTRPEALSNRIDRILQQQDFGPTESDVMFVLPGISQAVGGCHTVVEICNAAARLGMRIQLASLSPNSQLTWNEPLLLGPICFSGPQELARSTQFRPRSVVATCWDTVVPCQLFARALGIPCHYFVQGYECFFESGRRYGDVEETFRLVDTVLTTSSWLSDMIRCHYDGPTTSLPIGYQETDFNTQGRTDSKKTRICLILRGTVDKGQPILLETIHRLRTYSDKLHLSVLTLERVSLPSYWINRCEVLRLPLRRRELAAVLKRSDIYIDASLHEGWGLFALEALACGCAVVVSDSGGVLDYARDGVNALVVCQVNKPEVFVNKIKLLLDKPEFLRQLQRQAPISIRHLTSRCTLERYTNHLAELPKQHRSKMRSVRHFDRMVATQSATTEPWSHIERHLRRVEDRVNDLYDSGIWRILSALGAMIPIGLGRLATRLARRKIG